MHMLCYNAVTVVRQAMALQHSWSRPAGGLRTNRFRLHRTSAVTSRDYIATDLHPPPFSSSSSTPSSSIHFLLFLLRSFQLNSIWSGFDARPRFVSHHSRQRSICLHLTNLKWPPLQRRARILLEIHHPPPS